MSGVGQAGAATLLFFAAFLALPAAALPGDMRNLRNSRRHPTRRHIVTRVAAGALLPTLAASSLEMAPNGSALASVRHRPHALPHCPR